MKICPKCYKSNPDNGKKCFFCGEDLREILPYVPQEEPQEPEIEEEKALDYDEDFDENFDEEENLFKEKEAEPKKITVPKIPKLKININIKFKPINIVTKIFPIFSALIMALTVFITVCLITEGNMEENLLNGILKGTCALIIGSILSLAILWMNAIIHIFKKDDELITDTTQEEKNNKNKNNTENL